MRLECFSDADPKGSDCYEKFSVMQECMSHYPELYGKDDDDELAAAMDSAAMDSAATDSAATDSATNDKPEPIAAAAGAAGDAR